MAQQNVSTRLFSRVVESVRALGLDADVMCRDAGFNAKALADVEGTLPVECYFAMWALGVERSGDRSFPLEVARNFSGVHNLVRFVCKASDTLGDALARACRYVPSMAETTRWRLEPQGDESAVVTIERTTPRDWPGTAFADEYNVAEIVCFGRFCAQERWTPLAATFVHEDPATAEDDDPSGLRADLGCPVRYGAEHTSIAIPKEALALAFVEPDPQAIAFFSQMLDRRLPGDAPVVVDVEGQWIQRSDGGKTSLARKATLRRLLKRLVDARVAAPGQPVGSAELIELGWPGERVAHEAAMNRLRVAMARLRQSGLDACLVSERGGYWLAPSVALMRGS